MKTRIILSLLLLVACTRTRDDLTIQASVFISQPDLVEINEAFKNSGQEKRIELRTMAEAVCAYTQCGVPFRTEGPVIGADDNDERAKLAGQLIFTPKSAARLLKMMERSREFAKEMPEEGESGGVICDRKTCTLKFPLRDRKSILVDKLLSGKTQEEVE